MSIPNNPRGAIGYWKAHLATLIRRQKELRLSDELIECIRQFTCPQSIQSGLVRPGNLGRWDLFHQLNGCASFSLRDKGLACGLVLERAMAIANRNRLSASFGIGVDDYEEIIKWSILETMTKEEQSQLLETL